MKPLSVDLSFHKLLLTSLYPKSLPVSVPLTWGLSQCSAASVSIVRSLGHGRNTSGNFFPLKQFTLLPCSHIPLVYVCVCVYETTIQGTGKTCLKKVLGSCNLFLVSSVLFLNTSFLKRNRFAWGLNLNKKRAYRKVKVGRKALPRKFQWYTCKLCFLLQMVKQKSRTLFIFSLHWWLDKCLKYFA